VTLSSVAVLSDVTVVIPTVGRPMLEGCLEAIVSGDAWPARLIVVDQSNSPEVARLIAQVRSTGLNAEHQPSSGRGTAAATNRGIEQVRTRYVAVTHDDCRPNPDWLRRMTNRLHETTESITTGSVKAEENEVAPSLTSSMEAATYVRPLLTRDPLFPANMGFAVSLIDRLGLFDEDDILRFAEDAEWSYRALRSGVRIHFAPEVGVTHLAWRDARQRAITYRGYARSQGAFYGKYIRKGDWFILIRAIYDLLRGLWIAIRALATRNTELSAIGHAYLTQLLPGILSGLRTRRPR